MVGNNNLYVMVSLTYTFEYLQIFCTLLRVKNMQKYKMPSIPDAQPKLYSSPLWGEYHH